MAIDTYDDLKSSIGSWIHRSDLSGQYDDFIALTEGMLKRVPKPPQSPTIGGIRADYQTETGTLTASDNTLTPSATYLEIVSFTITNSGSEIPLTYLGPAQLDGFRRAGTAQPAYYTIRDGIEFDVAPDSNYAYTIEYYPEFTGLSGSNASNWVLDNYPEAYLAGCLYHANRFVQNEQEAINWLQQYKNTAWGASSQYKRRTESQGAIQTRSIYQ